MREVIFSIYHHDCWCPKVSSAFPENPLEMISLPILLKRTDQNGIYSVLWRFSGSDAADLEKMLCYTRDLKQTNQLRVLEKKDSAALVCLRVKSGGWVVDRILESNCHQIKPLVVSGGTEQWHVVTENVSDVKNLLSSLEEVGEVKVRRIGKYTPDKGIHGLTSKQEHALSLAVEKGYYSWPRKVTLEELAQVAKTSRKVYQEHLRKAEGKLMPKFVETINGEF